jgi:hypothetical protein
MLQFPRWRVDVTVGGDLVKTFYETATTSAAAIGKAKHKMRGAVSSAGAFKFKAAKAEAREPGRHHATKKSPAQLQREIDEALTGSSGRSKYHLTPSSPKKLFRYTKSELEAMPTISQGQVENLKVEGEVEGIPTRWWLTRMTVEDGEKHAVHVEQLIDGRWQEVHTYGRADTAASRQ